MSFIRIRSNLTPTLFGHHRARRPKPNTIGSTRQNTDHKSMVFIAKLYTNSKMVLNPVFSINCQTIYFYEDTVYSHIKT